MAEVSGMDAVLAKLGKKLGRKPMLRRKGLTNSEPLRPPGMTVVIGLGKPMGKKGAFAKRDEKGYPTEEEGGDDEEMVTETSPEGLSAKLDALMERLDAIEAKMGMNEESDEDDEEMEDEEDNDMEDDD
jgi:hypothetical protein